MVKWLKHHAYDQLSFDLKPSHTIPFGFCCALGKDTLWHSSPAWWSWQAVLNLSHISIKLQADCNILVSLKAGRGNCLPYVLVPSLLSCESGG